MDQNGLASAAQYMPIFPLIGAFTGLIAGTFTWSLESILPSLLAGALGLGIILLLNGAQHIDGLLDFGDGIMCHGSRARKLRVMRDPQTGAGGFVLGWITLTATALAIASISRNFMIQSLLASEAAAAFSMVLEAWAGKAAHRGMSSMFVSAMHTEKRDLRVLLSVVLLLLIVISALYTIGILVIIVALAVPLTMLLLSEKAFGGITGDVMGATNEVTRLTSLVIILVGMRWL